MNTERKLEFRGKIITNIQPDDDVVKITLDIGELAHAVTSSGEKLVLVGGASGIKVAYETF
jgi:hypothetical protein